MTTGVWLCACARVSILATHYSTFRIHTYKCNSFVNVTLSTKSMFSYILIQTIIDYNCQKVVCVSLTHVMQRVIGGSFGVMWGHGYWSRINGIQQRKAIEAGLDYLIRFYLCHYCVSIVSIWSILCQSVSVLCQSVSICVNLCQYVSISVSTVSICVSTVSISVNLC